MAGASSLRVGDRVRLQGLASRPELNGRHGKALRFVKENSRWKVWLDGEAKDSSLALKAENIQVLPKYGEALARTALAGRRRAGLEPGAATRLHTVHVLGATEWELSLQYAALAEVAAPRVGDRVQLVGLESKPELNGSSGVSERFLAEKGRWKVVLDDKPKGSLVIKPENLQVIPTYDKGSIEGPWLQEGDRHVVRGARVYGPEGETVEDIEISSPTTFAMKADGEVCTATLQPDGKSLSWSDGDVWHRPPDDDALLEVVLVGPDLPESHPKGELQRLPDWPEPGVSVACFRGLYEDFAASSSFASPGLTVLAHPGLCGASGGGVGGFFSWAPALHALASSGSPLCVCTGTEPYDSGEWLGDGIYDEQVLKGCGFEILAPAARNSHGCVVKEHPSCGWHLWAFTVAFRWPKGKEVKAREDWLWQAYYACRRQRCELPRFRFRPTAPDLKPELLKQRDNKGKGEDGAEKAEGEAEKDAEKQEDGVEASEPKGGEPSTRLMDDDEEDAEAFEAAEKEAQAERPSEDDEEKVLVAGMEWVGSTVQAAWSRGGGACKAAAAAAAAIAAAEEFADRTRSRPLPPGHQHVPACGACELAARIGASVDGGNVAVAAACAAVVTVFECLAYEALWNQHGCFNIDMVGHIVLGGLNCAEKAGVKLESGVASAVGAHASDAYELLSGPNQPPVKSLIEEFMKLADRACESAGAEASERSFVAQAVADNLDLSIPARGGREATLRISCKMHDAPRYVKVPEMEN